MRLIHHHNDVVALTQYGAHVAELEDGGNHNLALVATEEFLQFLLACRGEEVWYLGACEVSGYLVFQIHTVIHNHHRRIMQFRHVTQFLRGKHHQP